MPASRRSVLTAAGAGLVLSRAAEPASSPGRVPDASSDDDVVSGLIQRSARGNSALMRGDVKRYLELITFTNDFTLMSPFGGTPTRASDFTSERMEAMGRFFKNGTFDQEVVHAYGSADLVVLAIIERQHVEVGGLPAQDWPLRVTLVYRREGTEWRLAHRHADPLVQGISVQQAAALARGESAVGEQ